MKKSALFLIALLCLVTIISQIPGADTNHINGDESLSYLCWNHSWRGVANCSRIYNFAPPLDMALGKAFWAVISAALPQWTALHIELTGRLYTLLLATAGIFFLLLSALELTGSVTFVFFLWSTFFASNFNIMTPFVDLKFHAAMFFFTCFSWYAFTKFITLLNRDFRFWLCVFLIAEFTGFWFNILTLMSIFAHGAILGVAWLFNKESVPLSRILDTFKKNRFAFFTLAYSTASLLAFALYWKFRLPHDHAVGTACVGPIESIGRWATVFKGLSPAYGLLIVAFPILIGALTLAIDKKKRNTLTLTFIFLVPAIVVGLGTYLARNASCINMYWEPRHVSWSLFFLAYALIMAVSILDKLLNTKTRIAVSLLWLFLGIYPLLSTNGLVEGKPAIPEGDGIVKAHRIMRTRNLNPVGVIGININSDRTLTEFEANGENLALAWEIYIKGMKSLPNIRDIYSEEKKNAGLLAFKCAEKNRFPIIIEPENREKVLVDFCDLKNVVFRKAI